MSRNFDDISKLVKFIDNLESQLEYFIKYRSKSFESERDHKQTQISLLRNAWEFSKPRFITLRNNLNEMNSTEKLQQVGLIGYELDLKLHFVNESLTELKTEEDKFLKLESPTRFSSITKRISRLRNSWEKYLDFADTILGSLSVAGMPNADAIAEIKETIEKLIHWWKK